MAKTREESSTTDQVAEWFAENVRQGLDRKNEALGVKWNLRQHAEAAGIGYDTMRRWVSRGISREHAGGKEDLERLTTYLECSKDDLFRKPDQLEVSQFDRQSNPVIESIISERPDLFDQFAASDWKEIYLLRGHGGALTREGVIVAAEKINAKRELRRQFEVVMESHYFRSLKEVVEAFHRAISTG